MRSSVFLTAVIGSAVDAGSVLLGGDGDLAQSHEYDEHDEHQDPVEDGGNVHNDSFQGCHYRTCDICELSHMVKRESPFLGDLLSPWWREFLRIRRWGPASELPRALRLP